MDASDRLKQAALLGHMMDEETKRQVSEANPEQCSLAATQLDAAHICVQNALDILEKMPNTSSWTMMLMLRMMTIQLTGYSNQLMGRKPHDR